jgi:DNA-binding NarL/FixJ family response regulator
MTVRLLIADDHPVFVSGLGVTFADCDDIEVVGTAQDGEAAVAAVAELEPDVVLMDLRMPRLNGIEATRAIAGTGSSAAIVVLTMFDDDASVFTAMAAGARGYLVKGAPQERIVDAVRSVAAGELVFGSDVAAQVLAFFAAPRARTSPAFPELTERETEVLELVASGQNNARIARDLGLSEKTVRNHVSSIFAKLRVADRSEAIVRAREAGLGGG